MIRNTLARIVNEQTLITLALKRTIGEAATISNPFNRGEVSIVNPLARVIGVKTVISNPMGGKVGVDSGGIYFISEDGQAFRGENDSNTFTTE